MEKTYQLDFESFNEWAARHDWILAMQSLISETRHRLTYLTPNGNDVSIIFDHDRIDRVTVSIETYQEA